MMLELEEFLVIGGESSLLPDIATEDEPVESFLTTSPEAFGLFGVCVEGIIRVFDCEVSITDEE